MTKDLLLRLVYLRNRLTGKPFSLLFRSDAVKAATAFVAVFSLLFALSVPNPLIGDGKNLPSGGVVAPASASAVYYNFSAGGLWLNLSPSNTNMITSNDDWSGVASVEGYEGRNLTGTHGIDPRTVLGTEFTNSALPTTASTQVNANKGNPSAYNAGGITEFDRDDIYFAFGFQGNVQANPYMVFYLNTVGRSSVKVNYDVIDIDAGSNNSVSPVALQYRIGETGNFTNLPDGFVADATDGPNLHGRVTSKSVTLPAAADNKPQVQVRIITTNAAGTDGNSTPDEWIGVNNILITASLTTAGSATIGGRVVSPYGRGLANATVTMFDVFGERRTARANSFGYYRFADVPAGRVYYFQVNSKKYVFEEPIRVLSVEDDFGALDFYAAPLDDYSTGNKY